VVRGPQFEESCLREFLTKCCLGPQIASSSPLVELFVFEMGFLIAGLEPRVRLNVCDSTG
jgi:hypothetical protein